jgi:UDP-N-acetylmuramate dehydrogenase
VTGSWREELAAVGEAEVRFNCRLAPYTSFGVGGPAECLVEPRSREAACEVVRRAHVHGVPLFVLGNGTNVLVRDGGIPGVTLRVAGQWSGIELDGTRLRVRAGTSLSRVCETAAGRSLSGVEFLAGVPGTVGGATIMNAGAWEHSISECVREVCVADRQGEVQVLKPADLGFDYRRSALQDGERVVLEVLLELSAGDEPAIRQRMMDLVELRCQRQPVSAASAGSTFERPPGDYAGRLIEAAGLKGYRLGGAQVSPKHANFLANVGGATATDLVRLIEYVRERVQKDSGVRLQAEVRIVGVDAAPEVEGTG